MTARRLLFLLLGLLATPPAGGATLRVPADLPLQAALDASAPGDTVLVAPGTYPKAVTVGSAVLVRPDPDLPGTTPVLAGVSGTLATLRGFELDGSLAPERSAVVEGDGGLTLQACDLRSGVVGLRATGPCLLDGTLTGFVQAVELAPGATGVTVSAVFLECGNGVIATATAPSPPFGRTPAGDPVGDPDLELVDCRFVGGDLALEVAGPVHVRMTGSRVEEAKDAIRVSGGALRVEDSVFLGPGSGIGLDLAATGGSIRTSRVTGFATGVRVGDGGTTVYTTVTLGGALVDGNTLGGSTVDLALVQPEWIDADENHWGTLDCSSLGITGMTPGWIADPAFIARVACATPTEATTWGALKTRFGEAP